MMLGGVGFQVGLDEARRKAAGAGGRQAAAPKVDVVEQLTALKALHDDGVLTPEEFRLAKRQVLGD